MLGHLDPEFIAILDETIESLRVVFGTSNDLTLPISGTGSAGMETAFVNTVGPGDVAVIGVNGVFGTRMCEVARRCGAEVVAVEAPWGQPIDADQLLSAHPDPKVIAVVHAETSTGVRTDLAEIGAGKGDALFLVDCVTSIGGIELKVDEWGIDLAYAGTQKCLGVAPGLAPFTASERARERFVDDCPSWYFDLSLIAEYTGAGSGSGRTYHHTAPVSMITSLHAGLGALLDEGLDAAIARHAECGDMIRHGMKALGFSLFAAADHRLPQLTTVKIADRISDEAAVRSALLDRYGIEVGGGLGPVAGEVWRIGCMGHTARPRNVVTLLGALTEVLGR